MYQLLLMMNILPSRKIDHIMIYHIGAKAIVEMHIVMSENLPLKVRRRK